MNTLRQPQANLSIVIPAYNEAERLPRTLDRLTTFFSKKPITYEIIVVDDGSIDETRHTVETRNDPRIYCLVNGANRGKGYAVRRGVLAAHYEWILVTDADLSAPIEELSHLLAADADVAIGSRAFIESKILARQPRYREIGGKVFNGLVQALLLPGIFDTQCGFKLFRYDAAHQIFSRLTLTGFAFDVEVLFIAKKLGYTVREIPITWAHDSETRVRVKSEIFSSLADLAQIRLNGWKGRYRR